MAHPSTDSALIDVRLEGKRFVFWPFGETIAVEGTAQLLALPDHPWEWREGWFYIRHETLEVLLGRGIAAHYLWDLIPFHYAYPRIYAQDIPVYRQEGLRIVLDPGHGGEDEGTRSPTGVPEKEITLAIVEKTARLLVEKGHRVYFTREGDYTVPLRERVRKANELKADLFISVHCNSGKRLGAQGWETYILSSHASDPEALELALLENQEEGETTINELLKAINRNYRENVSFALAQRFHREVLKILKVEDRGVKRAPFYVLLATEMPAFLVEVGFLSNSEEARRLKEPRYQNLISRALSEAIDLLTPFLLGEAPGTG